MRENSVTEQVISLSCCSLSEQSVIEKGNYSNTECPVAYYQLRQIPTGLVLITVQHHDQEISSFIQRFFVESVVHTSRGPLRGHSVV